MRRKDEREKRFARLREENGIPHPPRPKETEKTVAVETLKEPYSVVGDGLEKKGWGDGNTPSEAGNIRDESGLMPRRVQAMTARAANWQQQNRFKLDRTAKEIEEIIQSEEATIYDEIVHNAIQLMRSKNRRSKSIGVRTGATLARIVQSDDHAKLRAEQRPLPMVPVPHQVVIDQSTHEHVDQRRVMFIIPQNGRDVASNPENSSQVP